MKHRRWPGRVRGVVALGLAVAALIMHPGGAVAYEFEVSATTLGQGYSLRSLRLSGPDLMLSRRRLTQTLSLSIWDINGRQRDRRPYDVDRRGGPNLSFTSYLRIDHDFGAWSTGAVTLGNRVMDAVDLVPELEASLLGLDMLYAYFAAEGLADGLLDVYVGRQLGIGTLDWWSMDGVTVRLSPPGVPAAVEAFGGLRVRDSSPLGSSVHEPDGTSSAECMEYVEGPMPGSGAWRPIDLQRPVHNDRFRNDYDYCPQRLQAMPTWGGAIETRGLREVWARVDYRRSVSPTPGRIGPVDRFEFPDTGLYPNELGQAPGWGVNEDRVSASARVNRALAGGRAQLTPHAAARYNLLIGGVDEAHAGVRLRYGAHSVEPEIYYSLPTFDGDSIFNIFSVQPYTDVRMTYHLQPAGSRVAGYGRAWLRRFEREDEPTLGEATGDVAGGAHVGARYLLPDRVSARLDLFHDAGYGGTRTGGHVAGAWQASRQTGLRTRVSVIHMAPDLREEQRGVLVGVQAGATYRVNQGVLLHVLAEETMSTLSASQFRLIGVIDLAFHPET